MNPKIYQQIHKISDSIITHYRDDLLKHDREFIRNSPPDLPFIHYTRAWGTHVVALHQPQHLEAIFQDSTHTKYLFGFVTRREFIRKKIEEHGAIMAAFGPDIEAILYYNPGASGVLNLYHVASSRAYEIIEDYVRNVE